MPVRRTAALAALVLLTLATSSVAAAQSENLSRPVVIPAGAPLPVAPAAAARTVPVRGDSAALMPTDVARRAADVFGDSMSATPTAVPAALAPEPTWDMDVRSYETQDRVAHYVQMFSGRARERISDRLSVGTRYEPMIRAKLKAGGLPEDMYYLALVESGFDPHAYSRAAAVGMWQFMTSTARDMGLRVDWWVDERRDPVRSTAAAVRFIRGLRDQFGSLYLAAAAYNGGPGRVSRGLSRYADDVQGAQGEDAFFVLAEKDYLKEETSDYVPQLIAAALVGKDPSRYGMDIRVRPPFAYDSVLVPAATPLAAVARAARVPMAEITELNPQLLRGMTPPRDMALVRVPVGAAAAFDAAFGSLPHEDLVGTHVVESRKGDTPARLASAHGIPETALLAFNPMLHVLKSGRLAIGQPVLVPVPSVAAAALMVPDPGIEKYPSSTKHMKLHTVKRGETVGGIARKYATTSERIMRLNGLRKPMIFPGQSLIVAGSAQRATGKKATRLTPSPHRKGSVKAPPAAASSRRKSGGHPKATARSRS
ncbi:MAG: transglycosylase SLT domain-containing protein [bacterium]